jgi:hypothetical protein
MLLLRFSFSSVGFFVRFGRAVAQTHSLPSFGFLSLAAAAGPESVQDLWL